MRVEMIVEKTKKGYSAYSPKYPVYTVASSFEKLRFNMLEAMNLFFEKRKIVIQPKDLKITLDLPQFFEFYKVINAKALSERIGMNQSLLAQYIKGIKKPSQSQILRILNGVRQVGRELVALNFSV